MSTPENPFPTGTHCWAELITSSPVEASAFYADIFGWDQQPALALEAAAYGSFYEEGQADAGIGWLPSGTGADGLAQMWLIHIAADDVDATAAAVQEHGGRLLRPPCDRAGLGRSAVAVDPTGAVFAITQLRSAAGPSWQNESGALIWSDLRTADLNRAREFYAAVFGYEYADSVKDPGYTTLRVTGSDEGVGGMEQLDPVDDAGVLSHWLVYLSLDKTDTDTAAVKTHRAGGTLRLEPYDSIVGRSAVLADPQGAVFAIIGGEEAAQFS